MGNREAATKEILAFIDSFAPGSPNVGIMEDFLGRKTDKEFKDYMDELASGKSIIPFYFPNNCGFLLRLETVLGMAERMGYEFFQYLDLTDPDLGIVYRTPIKHLVVDLPSRRQVQMLVKKMSVPENNSVVDERSGQPAHESKGASISNPEARQLDAKQHYSLLYELMKVRGGDAKSNAIIERSIIETGSASQHLVEDLHSRPKAIDTLKVYLTGMGLRNTL